MHRTVFDISGSHDFFHDTFTSHVIKGQNRWNWFLSVQLNQIHFIYIGRKSQSRCFSGVRVRTTPSVLRPSIPVRKTWHIEKQNIKSIRSIIFVCLHWAIATSAWHIFWQLRTAKQWQSTPENLQREGNHGGEEGGNSPKCGFISPRMMTTHASNYLRYMIRFLT